MSEPLPEVQGAAAIDGAAAAAPQSAGALLKAAREREGLHLSVLAATIKVTPAKLQALEQDRYDELPNATFTRALAQSVCRSLKIDPRPVLALLPQVDAPPLEAAVGKINAPFRERGGRGEGMGLSRVSKPMFWAGGVLLLAAVIVGVLPSSLLERARAPGAASSPAIGTADEADAAAAASSAAVPETGIAATAHVSTAASAASAASAVSPAAATRIEATPAGAPAAGAASAAVLPAAAPGLLSVRSSAPSWVEVVDAEERVLLSRVLEAGETVQLDGRPPLRVRIGNAEATALFLRGQPVDLAPHTRVNVARLELR